MNQAKIIVEHSKRRAIYCILDTSALIPKYIEAGDIPGNVFEKGLMEVKRYILRYCIDKYRHLARDAIITIAFNYNKYVQPIDYEMLWVWV